MPDWFDEEEKLAQKVENGELTEDQALKLISELYRSRPSPDYVRSINEAHSRYMSRDLSEDLFYKSLLKFIEKTVKRHSQDPSTFCNIEDAISNSLLNVWQRLATYDARRSTFGTFVTVIVLSQIRMLLREYRSQRGHLPHIQLDEELPLPTSGLDAEHQLLYEEWYKGLGPPDREIIKMLQDGLTQEEVGQALGISQQAIAKRLLRMRRNHKRPF
jgi:RNA polymerase sigma factor (sigma-70 family)